MNDNDSEIEKTENSEVKAESAAVEFDVEAVTSSTPLKFEPPVRQAVFDVIDSGEIEAETDPNVLSPLFRRLAEPKLPVLIEENRAYLQMQSPTRVFFYWSVTQNSFETLRRAIGPRAEQYSLTGRIVNLNTNKEDFFPVESKGSWWFNVEPNSKYRAEIGFYAAERPFIRLVFSNTLETPRLKPSDNRDYQPYFDVTSNQFAEVLDLAGFATDAFEVYLKGDEPQVADEATRRAFLNITGKAGFDFSGVDLDELRYILFAIASGVSLASLRDHVSPALFEMFASIVAENSGTLTEEHAVLALEEFFGIGTFDEEEIVYESAPSVFGASLINFPKQFRLRKSGSEPKSPKLVRDGLSPVSSSVFAKRR